MIRTDRVPRRAAAVVVSVSVALLVGCAAISPRPATTPVAMPADAPTAAPGMRIPLRTPVTLHLTHLQKVVPVQFAVLGAYAGDTAYWDTVKNGKDYAGLVPVWVVVQYHWRSIQETAHLALTATTSDGSTARTLVFDLIGGSPQCGIRLENSRDIVPEGMTCVLVAMRHPKALTGIEFRGLQSNDTVTADPAAAAYARSPLHFTIVGGAKPVPAGAADPDD